MLADEGPLPAELALSFIEGEWECVIMGSMNWREKAFRTIGAMSTEVFRVVIYGGIVP